MNSESSECSKIFRSKFNKLHADLTSASADTVKLAIALYSRSIVGKGVREEVSNAATPERAASKLLGAVETRIESHPRDITHFLECLGSFSTWQHHAEEFALRLKEVEAHMVKPLPVSEPNSSPASLGSGALGRQPVDIRLFISSSGVVVNPVRDPQHREQENFELRSAPVHRKHQPTPSDTPSQPGGKHFPQASSPASSVTLTPSSSCSLSVIAEETRGDFSPSEDGTPPQRSPSLASQTSTCSTFEDDVLSMKGSLDELLQKFWTLRNKLRTTRAERDSDRKRFAAGIEVANQETNELKEQVDTLQYENRELHEELDTMRERVVEGNRQKKKLMEQLRASYDELKHYKELCVKLEGHVKAAAGETNCVEYQMSEERVKELEAYKEKVKEYEEKIELLEMEVNFLLGSGSISLGPSDSEEWAGNPEQEDSGGLDSL